ncbi:hypothetical protein NLU13_7953 [Sarocladium strictum]|uniref:Zn(2)-C6 fungal-type domain-containing protein n=1 Tax=Sarocladium strictum TaxID=5046 RepID=A0AA39GB81_SARSR|nr:hypothetical protein NLU13_7953 [Sarocladium strictum]
MASNQYSGEKLVRKMRKKRLPKACGACRSSKVKCDRRSPCSRCRHLQKDCIFERLPKDEKDIRIESLEKEISELKSNRYYASVESSCKLSIPSKVYGGQPSWWPNGEQPIALPEMTTSILSGTPSNRLSDVSPSLSIGPYRASNLDPGSISLTILPTSSKWSEAHIEKDASTTFDFLLTGLVTPAEAESYFETFYQGCHQNVPILDRALDTMDRIRARSGLLFSVICATGCRVLKGNDSQTWRLLNFHVRRLLNIAVASPSAVTLETIQALLIRACYVPERSFLTSLATRFAIELGIPESLDQLGLRCMSSSDAIHSSPMEDDNLLIRKGRTWLHLLNMGHILHVDASDIQILKVRGNPRRCRVLLQGALTTDLDLHLISQVELNVLRAETYSALSGIQSPAEEDILAIIREARMDIDVWFNDWLRILSQASSGSQERWLAQNLQVQRCWAEITVLCRAVRVSGVDNVEVMSVVQKEMLSMAKDSLTKHLSIIMQEPRHYLQNLRFAMDFVWAKCAFCFLLLLKLSILLPDNREETNRELLDHGRTLIYQLGIAGGGSEPSIRTSTGNSSSARHVYLQLLQTGLERFCRTTLGESVSLAEVSATWTNTARSKCDGLQNAHNHNDLESFVPDQFVFEWDFPGLTLFSCPTTDASWLDAFLMGALVGEDDFQNFGYYPVFNGGDTSR